MNGKCPLPPSHEKREGDVHGLDLWLHVLSNLQVNCIKSWLHWCETKKPCKMCAYEASIMIYWYDRWVRMTSHVYFDRPKTRPDSTILCSICFSRLMSSSTICHEWTDVHVHTCNRKVLHMWIHLILYTHTKLTRLCSSEKKDSVCVVLIRRPEKRHSHDLDDIHQTPPKYVKSELF